VALLVCCLLNMDRSKFDAGFNHPVTLAAMLLLGVYILSSIYSVGTNGDIQQSLRKMSRVLYFPLILPLFTALRWRRLVTLAYLIAVFISVATALILGYIDRPFFKDSIFTSLFVAYAIFILAHYVSEYPRYRRLILATIIVFTYYLLFVNYGRTGQLLFFALYGIFCWQKFGFAVKQQAVAAVLLAAIATAMVYLPSSFAQRGEIAKQEVQHYLERNDKVMPHTSSMGLRLLMAHNSIELITQRPILGWGAGGFKNAYNQFVAHENIDKQEPRSNPHNQYLLTWVEAGVLGILALLYLFYRMIREFMRHDNLDNHLGLGLVCAIAVGCLVNSWLLDFTSMFYLILFAAVFAGANKSSCCVHE